MNNLYLHRVFEQYGDDEQERLEFDLATFAVNEKHTNLGRLFDYYKSLMRADLPRATEFQPGLKLDSQTLEKIAWVETVNESPDNFVMQNHPAMPNGTFGAELTGQRLAEFPAEIHADALIVEYNRCRRLRRPMYHEIDQTIGGISRAYRRIMLPLVDERGVVTRVAYAYRFVREPRSVDILGQSDR